MKASIEQIKRNRIPKEVLFISDMLDGKYNIEFNILESFEEYLKPRFIINNDVKEGFRFISKTHQGGGRIFTINDVDKTISYGKLLQNELLYLYLSCQIERNEEFFKNRESTTLKFVLEALSNNRDFSIYTLEIW